VVELAERPTQKAQWLPDAGPKTLAALRIAAALATLDYVRHLAGFVLPPEGLRFPRPGTAWLNFLPATQEGFNAALVVAAIAAMAVLLGWQTRWAAWCACAAVFYGGWVTTLTGKVDHTHHLMWVLAILAVSPCANIWAIRRENRPGSYHWPVFAMIALIGLIYLGAGLQKVASAGLEWGWSDNLANRMLRLSWEKNQPVHQWLVDWPLASRLLGITALAFELTFLPLTLIPATRRWVWPTGLFFHWGTWWLLGISFLTLQLLYVVFLPWDKENSVSPATDAQRRLLTGLVAAVAVFAIIGVESAWPIAAYPGFKGIADHQIWDVEVVTTDGIAFITDLDQARQVSPQRILPLSRAALDQNPEALAMWLGAEAIYEVAVDISRGEVIERVLRYSRNP
jgi:hypothetical protein